MKKLIASLALIMSFTLMFSACAKKTEANDKTSSAPVQKSDRTPSALEKAAGTYVSDKFTLILSASDESIADIIVKSPDASNPEGEIWWTMTGEFAQDTGEIKYADCVKSTRVNGDVVEQLYENGSGTFYYSAEKITWADNEEKIADGESFVLSESTADQ